ncbi:MAG: S8/S53 family peptidase [Phycisphaerae bacterium]|nr:S8/S53 family peptidase [Phycisphaerae bacterium]
MRSRMSLLALAAALTMLVMGCSGPAPGGGGGGSGNQDGVVDNGDAGANGVDDIFVKDPVEKQMATLAGANDDGSEYTRDVPNNQIMLMFEADVSRAEAEDTLGQMQSDLADTGLELVGQIPDVGIYQLEIANDETDSDAAMARLDTVCEALRGYEGVAAVGYNELLAGRAVENDDDNSDSERSDRCAFAVMDYYQAIPLFDEVMADVSLNDVTVAIVDSGLWVESDQFDDVLPRTEFLGVPEGVTPYDWHLHKHGTNIAALLAADNGDGLVNGVALRVLGDRLHLIVGDAHIWGNYYSLARTLARARESVQLGADIVVLSLGRGAGSDRPNWLRNTQAQFSRIFDTSPDTLFIAAAANDNFVLNGNDAPAGMPNDNLLTVGGHQSCDPAVRYPQSCTGPGVELAGPATTIPGFVGDNMVGPARYSLDGNSFAAPLIASVAAMVKSIDPEMTGAELKEFLVDEDNTWPANADVGGRRVALIRTAGSALLTRAAGSISMDKLLDAFGPADDITDPSGYSVNRLCGYVSYAISGSHNESVTLNAPDIAWGPESYNYGIIGMGHQVVLTVSNGSSKVAVSTTAGFRLNEPYTGDIVIVVPSPEGDLTAGVDGSSGTFVLTECELTTRSLPLDWFSPDNSGPDQLIFIEVSGSFSGTAQGAIRLSDGEHIEGVSYAASGEFTTGFTPIFPEADTLDYLERNCVGGYLLGESEP